MISFNRSQRLGLNLDQHIALDAGAGTGKTTVMAERYVQHLLSAEQRATYVLPPPIRQEPIGSGKVLAAKRDRTPLNEWKGLLPQEIVAITFTRKAASELRSRIRQRIQSLRAHPVSQEDRMGVHDPRLRHQGDVSMLMSFPLLAAPCRRSPSLGSSRFASSPSGLGPRLRLLLCAFLWSPPCPCPSL